MVISCAECGKRRDVLYPELWRYKDGKTYFCSWGCLRKREGKMMKLTQEKKNRAIEIAAGGGDPLEYLKEAGSKNPPAAWYAIKQELKEEDPDTYNRLPDLRKRKTERAVRVEKVEKVPEIQEKLELEGGKNYELSVSETPEGCSGLFHGTAGEKAAETPEKITKAEQSTRVAMGEYEVAAVRKKGLGEFYYDAEHRTVDWRNPYGEEASLDPEIWRQLAEEIPKVLKMLGA